MPVTLPLSMSTTSNGLRSLQEIERYSPSCASAWVRRARAAAIEPSSRVSASCTPVAASSTVSRRDDRAPMLERKALPSSPCQASAPIFCGTFPRSVCAWVTCSAMFCQPLAAALMRVGVRLEVAADQLVRLGDQVDDLLGRVPGRPEVDVVEAAQDPAEAGDRVTERAHGSVRPSGRR